MTAKDYEKLADEAEKGFDLSTWDVPSVEEQLMLRMAGMKHRLDKVEKRLSILDNATKTSVKAEVSYANPT